MLLFCPSCSNQLIITPIPQTECTPEDTAKQAGKNRFECRTCPYQMILDRRYYERKTFESSHANSGDVDVLGGKGSWVNVDRVGANCPRDGCDGVEAYYKQAQIRSADEPMTTFFRCVTCGHDWREG